MQGLRQTSDVHLKRTKALLTAMDQVYQALYGPNEDRLKHCGAAWLAISLLANVAGSNITGFIGLLAILAVTTRSEYLLFLVGLQLQ